MAPFHYSYTNGHTAVQMFSVHYIKFYKGAACHPGRFFSSSNIYFYLPATSNTKYIMILTPRYIEPKKCKIGSFAAYACSDGCGDIVDGYDLYHLMAVFTIYNIAFIAATYTCICIVGHS